MTSVLVVDDSAVDRRLVGGLLGKIGGCSVTSASDGQDALVQLGQQAVDIVVTDMQMPNMDGLELVKAIRDQYPLLPVILMTAKGSEDLAVQALRHGAASYVPKRRLAEELPSTLRRVISAARVVRTQQRLMTHMKHYECSFELGNDAALLSSLVSYLREMMAVMQIGDDLDRVRVGIALEEALLNACYHGNLELSSDLRDVDHTRYYELAEKRREQPPYCDRRISVDVKLSPTEAVYGISDEGPGFDRSQLPDPTDPANIERCHGRGLLLIQTFMDEVLFNENGNEVTLIKRHAGQQSRQRVQKVS